VLRAPQGPRHRIRWLAGFFALTLALAALPASAAPRVVAVADVHGDLPAFREVLRTAGVIDTDDTWIGGETTLVQLGDLIDRGPAMRGTLDFVMALEGSAAERGGRVVALLGNHEVMNVVGDLRYVTPVNYAEFVDRDSEKRRQQAWRDVQRWQRERAAARGERAPPSGAAAKQAWLAAYPPGRIEHRAAFGPEGVYGRWLRARSALVVVQDTLFVHGGVAPTRLDSTLEALDASVRAELARFDELVRGFVADGLVLPFFDLGELTLALEAELAALDAAAASGGSRTTPAADAELRARLESFLGWRDWSLFASDGPFWFRGYANWSDEELAAELPRLLGTYGVERVVVGHTPQRQGSILARGDGAVFLIDTGMHSAYYTGGRGSALELAGGQVTAIYAGGEREVLRESSAPDPAPAEAPASGVVYVDRDGQPLPFAGDEELLAFLREAEVVEVRDIGEGITRPRRLTLERDGVRVRGVFRDVSVEKRVAQLGSGRREMNFRDFHGFEPAAYRLAKLLGFDLVPAADLRRYRRSSGSIQVWIENATTEGRRREAGTEPPDPMRWKRQLQMMLVWDALVGNTDRNQGNILFEPDWRLWLIDHTRAFRQSDYLEHLDRIIWCERGFYERLRAASDDEIRAAVDGLLRPGEIRGLLARREKLVAHLESLLRERGEASVLFSWRG
jgi:hypothetical protein